MFRESKNNLLFMSKALWALGVAQCFISVFRRNLLYAWTEKRQLKN
jgi:hypothetical protein